MPLPSSGLAPSGGLVPYGPTVIPWPTVVTLAPSSLALTTATLNGTVNPNGQATNYYFEWGLTTAYGNVTGTISAGSGSVDVAVSAGISGLSSGTGYHYRLVGVSAGGTAYGDDVAFGTIVPVFSVSKPPPDLNVEITTASGDRYLWDSGARKASDRPQGISFTTKRWEGFSTGGCTLGRRIDLDWSDLNLLDSAAFIGADGSVAFEGRLSGEPRTLDQGHHIDPVFTGWIAHARDRKFVETFVDRDISGWQDAPLGRKVAIALIPISMGDFSWASDQTGLICAFPNQALGAQTIAEAWYTAPPGVTVGKVMYQGNATAKGLAYEAYLMFWPDANLSVSSSTGLTLDNTVRTATPGVATSRYAMVRAYSNGAAGTPAVGANDRYSKLAVYGSHGLTTYPISGEPDGLYASDVFKNVLQRFCPQLGVHPTDFLSTSYPIPHIVFSDPTDPYDAFLFLNAFHLWEFGVWENRQMSFGPGDLTDYDWEVRLSGDFSATTTLLGDTTGSESEESLVNGVAITYTDFNGQVQRLTPDVFTQLADPNVENPANRHGVQLWVEKTIGWRIQQADAISIGQAILAQQNQPRGAGTVTVPGYIRDRAGHWEPAWKVRAGDTLIMADFPNDRPRMVVATEWNHDSKQLTISVDSTQKTMDAYFDRVATALKAGGVG